MRRLTGFALLAMATTLAGCLLLSPDTVDRSAMALRVVAREPLSKSPCGDAASLLSTPSTDELRAVAKVYRSEKDADELGELIASANLAIGEYDEGTASREMTGVLDLPLGPAGKSWSMVVELFYDGPVGRDPLGQYIGKIRLDSGLVVNAGLNIDTDLGSGAYGGQVGVSFGDLTGGASVDPILYDPDLNRMELGYESEPIAWNDDPEDMRVIEVRFEANFGPSIIYRAQVDLPDLVPGPVAVQLPTVFLDALDPAPLATDLSGPINVRFVDGRAPREQGKVTLSRQFTGCD